MDLVIAISWSAKGDSKAAIGFAISRIIAALAIVVLDFFAMEVTANRPLFSKAGHVLSEIVIAWKLSGCPGGKWQISILAALARWRCSSPLVFGCQVHHQYER
jgi:hypothetical protein